MPFVFVYVQRCLFYPYGSTCVCLFFTRLQAQSFRAVDEGESPSPRFAHTALMHSDGLMYIYGGTTRNGTVGDLWTWNTTSKVWTLIHDTPSCTTRTLPNCTTQHPPRIAGHTATVVDDTTFYVVGGRVTDEQVFHDAVSFASKRLIAAKFSRTRYACAT